MALVQPPLDQREKERINTAQPFYKNRSKNKTGTKRAPVLPNLNLTNTYDPVSRDTEILRLIMAPAFTVTSS